MRLLSVVIVCGFAVSHPCLAQTFVDDPDHLTSRIQVEGLEQDSLGAVDATPGRVLMPLALDVIKDYEKWVPNAYNDASRYCTIGYGHLIAKSPCESVVSKVAEYGPPVDVDAGLKLLDEDSKLARRAVQRRVRVPLVDEQFGALVSFVFNVGEANFFDSTLLKFVNNAEFESAARQFGRWIRSKGVVLNGLINRRACEAALFNGKLRHRPDGKFYRADCESLGAVPSTENLIDVEIGEVKR